MAKETIIRPGKNHLRLAFDFFAGLGSIIFGMPGNESMRDDCTSILFKAFRMELNLIIPYPNSIFSTHWLLGEKPFGNSPKPEILSKPGIMTLCSGGAYQKSLWICKE